MDAHQLRDGGDGAGVSATAITVTPVSAGASGEGLPYAPEDWPLPGDKWKWRVGLRATPTGFFQDRYTCPPARFGNKTNGHRGWICGRISLEKFICEHIPNADVEQFFASFIWKIPYDNGKPHKDSSIKGPSCSYSRLANGNGHMKTSMTPKDGECKAGNKMCYAWVQTRKGSSAIIDCDVCCSEVGFCRDCCCILCCKIVDLACGGFNFIRCQGTIDDEFICGHVAHLKCALRAYLAGKVQGSINLDAEYYCRRCDNKTDLVTHLSRLLSGSKTVHSRADTEKILNKGLFILRGSAKHEAKKLHFLLESMLKKLRDGDNLVEIWALVENLHVVTTATAGSETVTGIHTAQQQQLGRGETTHLNFPVPVLISSNGKEPSPLKLHEVPISLQIRDPSVGSSQEDLSSHKRSFCMPLPELEFQKKARREHIALPLMRPQVKETLMATNVAQEPREVCEEDSNMPRQDADHVLEAKMRINHLETELNEMKTKIVNRLKGLRRRPHLSHHEAKLEEATEKASNLNMSKQFKTSSGLKKLRYRLNRALGYCEALLHFHRKYPDTDISELYQSLRRTPEMEE